MGARGRSARPMRDGLTVRNAGITPLCRCYRRSAKSLGLPLRGKTMSCTPGIRALAPRHRLAARPPGRPAVVLIPFACAVALAACGSSGNGGSSAASREAAGLRFSECMRSHGISNFPDPSATGSIQLTQGSGLNPQAPAFQSAQNTCSKLLPGGGPGGGPGSEARKVQLLKLAQCMRRHGLSTFPDPTASPPKPGNGPGIAFGGNGAFLAVSQSLLQSPGFKQAAAACGFPGVPGGPKRGAAAG